MRKLVLITAAAVLKIAVLYALATRVVRPWIRRWGATDNEVGAVLPGDELTPDARSISTRAVTVHAPPERIYPWLGQIDQQRGGFYSYRFLENLVGCDMPKVERLEPGWTHRVVGEEVWMTRPDRYGGQGFLVVARAERDRDLVLVSPDESLGSKPMSGSWAFVLVPVDPETTRLVIRSRYARPSIGFEIIHFVMERKMLQTIARLAEATPAPASAAVTSVL